MDLPWGSFGHVSLHGIVQEVCFLLCTMNTDTEKVIGGSGVHQYHLCAVLLARYRGASIQGMRAR